MHLRSVSATGFRNLERAHFEPGEGITLLYGPNGAGKTNALDAIHFALSGSSIRGGYARDSISFGADAMRVELVMADSVGDHEVSCGVDRSGRRLRELDGQPPREGESLLRVAVFHPDLLQLVKGPPSERRSYVDSLTSTFRPSERDLRGLYGRTLAQRNALVRRVLAGAGSASDLATWDDRLAETGAQLTAARTRTLQEVQAVFPSISESLGLEQASIVYRPRASTDPGEVSSRLAALRADARELGRSYLQYGPHMDEVEVRADERPVRRFASQGQQRAAVLSLLLTERRLLVEAGRPAPILLLDDVMSELDPTRRMYLVDALRGGQAIVTATEPDHLPDSKSDGSAAVVRIGVNAGAVIPEHSSDRMAA